MDAGGSAKPGAFAEKDTPPGMEAVRAHGWAKVEQCRSNCRERRREQAVEDEGRFLRCLALTPALSPSPSFPFPLGEGGEPMRAGARTRALGEKSDMHYLAIGSAYISAFICGQKISLSQPPMTIGLLVNLFGAGKRTG